MKAKYFLAIIPLAALLAGCNRNSSNYGSSENTNSNYSTPSYSTNQADTNAMPANTNSLSGGMNTTTNSPPQ